METPDASPTPRPETPPNDVRELLRRLVQRISKTQFRVPWRPVRRLLLAALLVWGAVRVSRFVQRSFQAVPPGNVGVCVTRLTGSLAALPPGTHFRPHLLYEIHLVRISDQILSGESRQLQRHRPRRAWSPGSPCRLAGRSTAKRPLGGRRCRRARSVSSSHRSLTAAFRSAAPRYEVTRLVSEKREELAVGRAASRARTPRGEAASS